MRGGDWGRREGGKKGGRGGRRRGGSRWVECPGGLLQPARQVSNVSFPFATSLQVTHE